jgi:methionyl-tRNA formyltransferase
MANVAPLRLLFFGTPDFAVPALETLLAGPHPLVGLVCQPDRPRGRGRRLEPPPTKEIAERAGVPVLQPERVGEAEAVEWMEARAPDLGCVVAYGQFIPKRVRELPPQRLINAHASLLPRHRGAAPVQHAILAGDTRTGVTIIRITKEMDAGDWCLMRETPIGPDENAGELAARLARLAAEVLREAVNAIAAGEAQFRPQPTQGITLAPRIERDFGRLDWTEPADALLRRIRAATPWPGVDVRLSRTGRTFRIVEAASTDLGEPPTRAGRVQGLEGRLLLGAVDGWLEVLRLKAPGRRALAAAEYLRGARLPQDEEVERP